MRLNKNSAIHGRPFSIHAHGKKRCSLHGHNRLLSRVHRWRSVFAFFASVSNDIAADYRDAVISVVPSPSGVAGLASLIVLGVVRGSRRTRR